MARGKQFATWAGVAVAAVGVVVTFIVRSQDGGSDSHNSTTIDNHNTTTVNNNITTITNNIINAVSPPGSFFLIDGVWAAGHTGPGSDGVVKAGSVTLERHTFARSLSYPTCSKGGPASIVVPRRSGRSVFSAAVGLLGTVPREATSATLYYSLQNVPAAEDAGVLKVGWELLSSTPVTAGKTVPIVATLPTGVQTIGLSLEGGGSPCQSRIVWGDAGLSPAPA